MEQKEMVLLVREKGLDYDLYVAISPHDTYYLLASFNPTLPTVVRTFKIADENAKEIARSFTACGLRTAMFVERPDWLKVPAVEDFRTSFERMITEKASTLFGYGIGGDDYRQMLERDADGGYTDMNVHSAWLGAQWAKGE